MLVAARSLLAPGGRLVLGHTKLDTLELGPIWHERKLLKHGDTIIRLLEVTTPADAAPIPATRAVTAP